MAREKMGLKDSVVPDLYNENIFKAFDYKFGNAKVTSKQRSRYAKGLPRKNHGAPSDLTEVKPNIKLAKKRKQ